MKDIKEVWDNLLYLIKNAIGDVDVDGKGSLQHQLNNIKPFVKSGPLADGGLVPPPPKKRARERYLREDGLWEIPPDTKETAGSLDKADTKLYLIGSINQNNYEKTYSNKKIYINDNELYSNDKQVAHQEDLETLSKKVNELSDMIAEINKSLQL